MDNRPELSVVTATLDSGGPEAHLDQTGNAQPALFGRLTAVNQDGVQRG